MNNRFKKIILLLLAVIFIFLYAHRIVLFLEKKAAWHSLKEECIEKITNFKGQAHIVIIDLTQDWRFTYQDKDKVPAASIIKIPIMVSCFLADKEGKISIDDDIVLKQSDKAGGSGILEEDPTGSRYTVKELIELMIAISDNTACNMLIKLLGFDYLNSSFKYFMLDDTTLSRLMMDMKKRDKGIENYTSASDIAKVLKGLYRKEVISPEISEYCIEILKEQHSLNRIPKLLPRGTVVANKTGLEKHVCHDAGIVYTDKGDYIICVLTTHPYKTSAKSKKLISELSLLVYNYLNKP